MSDARIRKPVENRRGTRGSSEDDLPISRLSRHESTAVPHRFEECSIHQGQNIYKADPGAAGDNVEGVFLGDDTLQNKLCSPIGHLNAKDNIAERISQTLEHAWISKCSARLMAPTVTKSTSKATICPQRIGEEDLTKLEPHPQNCSSNMAGTEGEHMVPMRVSMPSNPSHASTITGSRHPHEHMHVHFIDAILGSDCDTFGEGRTADQMEYAQTRTIYESPPSTSRDVDNPDLVQVQMTQHKPQLNMTSTKMEQETIGSLNHESENQKACIQDRARVAFQQATDRNMLSGTPFITCSRAFQVMANVMEFEAGCKGCTNHQDIAHVLYRKIGPSNVCTEELFLQAYIELLNYAKARRRRRWGQLFRNSLCEGEQSLIVFHARDLLKKESSQYEIVWSNWSDQQMDDVFEMEASGMLVDENAFIRAAGRIVFGVSGESID